MCETLLCQIYQREEQAARKRLRTLRRHKHWGHWPHTIDREIELTQDCLDAAHGKIAALHAQRAREAQEPGAPSANPAPHTRRVP